MASSTLLLVAMTACVTVPAVTACQSATHRASLESWNWAYYERSWAMENPIVTAMELVKEHTEEHLCQANVTFGFYGHTTWVKDGCRGDFDVTTEMDFDVTLNEYSSDVDVGVLLRRMSDDVDEAEEETEQLKLKVGAHKLLIEHLTHRVANLTAEKAASMTEAPKPPTPRLIVDAGKEDGFPAGPDSATIYCFDAPYNADNIFVFYDKDGTVVQSNSDNYVDISPLEVSNSGDTYTCTLKLNDRESDHSNILEIKVLVQPEVLSNGLTLQYDNANDGGPWLIFQHRTSESDFNRTWIDYRGGFGDTDNYWMGLDFVYSYCNQTNMCKLRIDISRADKGDKYAVYQTFYLEGPDEEFAIHLTGYSGTAGDSMLDTSVAKYSANGMKFSTADNDNDLSGYNNAETFAAPWWWNEATDSPLNGPYGAGEFDGMFWFTYYDDGYSLSSTAMKLRQIP